MTVAPSGGDVVIIPGSGRGPVDDFPVDLEQQGLSVAAIASLRKLFARLQQQWQISLLLITNTRGSLLSHFSNPCIS